MKTKTKTKTKKRNKSLSGPEGMGTGAKLLLLALPVAGLVYYAMNRPGKAGADPALPPAAADMPEIAVSITPGVKTSMQLVKGSKNQTEGFVETRPSIVFAHPGGKAAVVAPISISLNLVLDDGRRVRLAYLEHDKPFRLEPMREAHISSANTDKMVLKANLKKTWDLIKENKASLKERPDRAYPFSLDFAYTVVIPGDAANPKGPSKHYKTQSPIVTVKLPVLL